jgi:hypothetical protein
MATKKRQPPGVVMSRNGADRASCSIHRTIDGASADAKPRSSIAPSASFSTVGSDGTSSSNGSPFITEAFLRTRPRYESSIQRVSRSHSSFRAACGRGSSFPVARFDHPRCRSSDPTMPVGLPASPSFLQAASASRPGGHQVLTASVYLGAAPVATSNSPLASK